MKVISINVFSPKWCSLFCSVPFIFTFSIFGNVSLTSTVYVYPPQLLAWLEEKLPLVKGKLPAEGSTIIPPLYVCLEDRNGEVLDT